MRKRFLLNRDGEYPEWVLFNFIFSHIGPLKVGAYASTKRCLCDFGQRVEKSGDFDHVIKELAVFVGVKERTVRAWLSADNERLPGGESLLRMQYLLDQLGYKVLETKKLSISFRNLIFLIAWRKVTLKRATEAIGVKKSARLLAYLTGRLRLSNAVSLHTLVANTRRFIGDVYFEEETRQLQLMADVDGELEDVLHADYCPLGSGKTDDDFLVESEPLKKKKRPRRKKAVKV